MKNISIEVLLSTMKQKDVAFLSKMNIYSNCLIINQTNYEDKQIIFDNIRVIKFLSFNERGLSRSRNKALEYATGDICLIADDDIVYEKDYVETIEKAYNIIPEADIIIFEIGSENKDRVYKRIANRVRKLGFYKSMKTCSVGITFKRESIRKKNITFNTLFGAGSKYICGEEQLFLRDCFKERLKIFYFPIKIATVSQLESSWFNGYDINYCISQGAFSYALFRHFYFLFIMQFIIRKYPLYRGSISVIKAIKYMVEGKKQFLNENPL